jgi:hypothetical protein
LEVPSIDQMEPGLMGELVFGQFKSPLQHKEAVSFALLELNS